MASGTAPGARDDGSPLSGAVAPGEGAEAHRDGPYGHRGTRAVQRMVEFAPSTGGLALWMKHRDLADGEALPGDAGHWGRAGDAGHAGHTVQTGQSGRTSHTGRAAAAGALAEAAPVSTDGETLYYSPAFVQRPADEQVGLVAHGVLHVALRHAQRLVELRHLLGDVDAALYNVCADAIVNSALSHLTWLRLPVGAVTLERLLADALRIEQPLEKSLLEWDVEALYRAVDDRGPAQRGRRADPREGSGDEHADSARSGGQPARAGTEAERPTARAGAQPAAREDGPRAAAARALGAAMRRDLRPGPGTVAAPEAEAEQTREWSERLARAHAGDGEFSMLRTLVADLPRTRTPWEQVLRAQLARGLMPQPALSWSRPARSYLANQGRAGPHRRMPWEPGFGGLKKVPRLAVMVDVSGSIDEDLLARFAREIEAIARRLEAALVLVVGDDRVRHVASFDPGRLRPGRLDLRRTEFQGGGGTDFTPLIEEADRHRPDIGVFLTDLEGPARMRPRWPVLWAVPEQGSTAAAPFGRKLALR